MVRARAGGRHASSAAEAVEGGIIDLPVGGELAGRPAAALVLAGGELVVTIVP